MTLVAILIGTLVAGIGSVWLAAALSFGVLARYTQHMLSLAAGALMATAMSTTTRVMVTKATTGMTTAIHMHMTTGTPVRRSLAAGRS
jgi:hypothetical protein